MALAGAPPQQLPPDVVLLSKIKARVAEELVRLPDFTCIETIRRSLLYHSSATPDTVDTVRLEVAFVNGKELYGWPGAGRIDQADLGRLVGGSIGNGYFALFLNNIFLVRSTTFQYVGPIKLDGQDTIQYDYKVPQIAGAYHLRSTLGTATVGYHGSFWVKEGTVDPIRIKVIVDDVPQDIGFSAATSELDYGTISIAGRSYVLPHSADIVLTDTHGNQHTNDLSFQTCHEFVGESTVKFESSETQSEIALPEEFTAALSLVTPLDSKTAAGGDRIEATLDSDLAVPGGVIPKGAKFSGRVGHATKNGAAYSLDLVFTAIDFPGAHVDIGDRVNQSSVKDRIGQSSSGEVRIESGAHVALHSGSSKSAK